MAGCKPMAKYRVKARSFIDGKLFEPGQEVEFSGKAGSNLELITGELPKVEVSNEQTSEELLELERLRDTYEEMFGEKPHFNTGAKTLKEKIDERRKELGV